MKKIKKAINIGQMNQFCIPGGNNIKELVEWEIRQGRGDGRDSSEIDRLEQQAKEAGREKLFTIYEELLSLSADPEFPYNEPNDLESIRNLRKNITVRKYDIQQDEEFLFDRIYGAWLGRSAGCTLGGPGEMFRPDTRANLKRYLTAISPDEWPMKDYMPCSSPKSGLSFTFKQDATREKLKYIPADDDLTHTVIGQIALSELENPLEFKTEDLARTWFRYMPYRMMEGGTGMMAMRNLILRHAKDCL